MGSIFKHIAGSLETVGNMQRAEIFLQISAEIHIQNIGVIALVFFAILISQLTLSNTGNTPYEDGMILLKQ